MRTEPRCISCATEDARSTRCWTTRKLTHSDSGTAAWQMCRGSISLRWSHWPTAFISISWLEDRERAPDGRCRTLLRRDYGTAVSQSVACHHDRSLFRPRRSSPELRGPRLERDAHPAHDCVVELPVIRPALRRHRLHRAPAARLSGRVARDLADRQSGPRV